jgi:D-alanine-D-alanine ligase
MENKMDDVLLYGNESEESDKPPSCKPRPVRPWRVAVVANVRGEGTIPGSGPEDAGAEFDKMETIQAIQAAIQSDGHHTVFIPADINLPNNLRDVVPDICFNISEGLGGDGREAQAPALFEMMHIPYTASRVTANAIALDKTLTKRIWRDCGLPVAPFQEFSTGYEQIDPTLRYPMFVKPAREGTGMGMGTQSICYNSRQLRERVHWIIQKYNQPALVEEYLSGREFTVGILGRTDAAGFSLHPEYYQSDGFHRMPVLEVDNDNSITPGVYGHDAKTLVVGEAGVPDFICPAHISASFSRTLQNLAIRGHQAVGALDVSRIDFRCDGEGKPFLLEINSLPGLSPGFSDLCVIANAEGVSYRDLILEILYLGASRFGLVEKAIDNQPEIEISLPMPGVKSHRTARVQSRQSLSLRARTQLR